MLMEFIYVELLLPMMAMSARIFLVGQPEAFIDWFFQQPRAIELHSIHWYAFHGLIHSAIQDIGRLAVGCPQLRLVYIASPARCG